MSRKAKLRVELVYWFDPSPLAYVSRRARQSRLWGSDALRLQIGKSMAPHLPENVEINFSGLSLPRSGLALAGRLRSWHFHSWLKTRQPAVFILLKNVAYHMSPNELSQLKDKAIAVGVDHKDAVPSRLDLLRYDFHISASETGRRAIEVMLAEDCAEGGRLPLAEVWYQSHDMRLEKVQLSDLDRVSAVYLGSPSNAAIPATLADGITIIDVQRSEEMERAVRELGKHNFHYAVRPNPEPTQRRDYKPFTKGVTAAACRSNILVNRQVDDAIEFLTPDYPYLVESNAPKHVEDGFRKAHEEFGGSEWRRGLEIMRSVRERVSGPAQARQFVDIVTRAAERAAMPVAGGRRDTAGGFPPGEPPFGEALTEVKARR